MFTCCSQQIFLVSVHWRKELQRIGISWSAFLVSFDLCFATLCNQCYKHKYFNCAVKKCIKDSALASFIAAVEGYTYWLLQYYKMIDIFLFQSEFSRDMHVKFGIEKKKTQIIENPYDCSNMRPEYDNKNFILYFKYIVLCCKS